MKDEKDKEYLLISEYILQQQLLFILHPSSFTLCEAVPNSSSGSAGVTRWQPTVATQRRMPSPSLHRFFFSPKDWNNIA
jgi:hypothetical protein